jgi:hypothetical protein
MGSTFLASERHKPHFGGQIWGQLERDSGAPAGKLGLSTLPHVLEKEVARGHSTSWNPPIEDHCGKHWTSTARGERVVMTVLGFTITLDLWDFVGLRVRGAEGLGGLA